MAKRAWYVIYCKPQKEGYAQFHLKLKGIEVFFPRLSLPSGSRERQRIIPLFPNYIFVRIDLSSEYNSVLWSPGVKRFVSFGENPAPLDDSVAVYLIEQADADGIITARYDLQPGQEVQMSGGSFEGLTGIIKEPPDAKGRVKVLMTLLNRQVNVVVPANLVRRGWMVTDRIGQAGLGFRQAASQLVS
jgi:transcriptional antiterminator RfaH